MAKRSCILTYFSQYVSELIDSISQLDVIYLDFQKAFNEIILPLQKYFNYVEKSLTALKI